MDKNRIVKLLGLAGFIVMADNWVVSPILPAISKGLGISVARAGLVISAYMIPFGIFQILFGPLADRYGKAQVVTWSLVFFTIATALCAVAAGLTDLALYRALTGVFAASVMPISLALIGDLFPVQERQGAIGTFMGISFLGQGLSMIIGGTMAFFVSWRGVFALYAVLSMVPTALMIRRYRSLPSSRNPGARFLAPYSRLLGTGRSLFTYILVLMEGVFIIGSFSYLGAHIARAFGFNYLLIGLIMTGFGLATVAGGRASGRLASRMGARKLLSLGFLCAATADLLVGGLGSSLVATVVGVVLLGFGFIFAHSTLLTRATEFAQKARGAAMSLVAFCFMGGGGLGTALGSRIIEQTGLDSFFLTYGIALMATLAASFLLIRDEVVAPNEAAEQVAA